MPTLSTPEGVLAFAETLTKIVDDLVAAKNAGALLEPLAAQARTHDLGNGHQTKQDFAREIVPGVVSKGIRANQPDVIERMARELDLFVAGDPSDRGVATRSGVRRGLSVTDKGTAKNGYAYATVKRTPKGADYAWARLKEHITTNRTIILRKKGLAASPMDSWWATRDACERYVGSFLGNDGPSGTSWRTPLSTKPLPSYRNAARNDPQSLPLWNA